MDPDQPASSGSTLFVMQFKAIMHDLVSFRVICIYLLKIASDGAVNVLKVRTLKNNYFFRCS